MSANERHQIKDYPTPLPVDLIFYEIRDSTLPRNERPQWAYGDPHPDKYNYPNHELVLVKSVKDSSGAGGKQAWYYAARRENQDEYNYEIFEGEQLVRTYIIPRSLYFSRPVDHVDAIEGEFLYPPAGAGSPDDRFPQYCFADDTLRRGEKELDSLYNVIQRRFLRPSVSNITYNETLKMYITETKTIIPKDSFVLVYEVLDPPGPPDYPEIGSRTEKQDGNFFHDIQIDRVISDGDIEFPREMPSIPTTINRNFPRLLDSVELVWAFAYADSSEAAYSYSEDFYFDYKITQPSPGPYSALLRRFITDDPEALKTTYPLEVIPQPVEESISVVGAWFSATDQGNSTSATAKEWPVPATIHDVVTVTLNRPEGDRPTGSDTGAFNDELEATPGHNTFFALANKTLYIDYQVRELPLGLYEVSVVEIDRDIIYPSRSAFEPSS